MHGQAAPGQGHSNGDFEVVPARGSDSEDSDDELDNLDTQVQPAARQCLQNRWRKTLRTAEAVSRQAGAVCSALVESQCSPRLWRARNQATAYASHCITASLARGSDEDTNVSPKLADGTRARGLPAPSRPGSQSTIF